MMLKTVVIVCDYGYIEGGAAKVAHATAIALQKEGIRVIFFCAVAPVSEELLASGVEVVCLHQEDILHEKNRVKGVLRGIHNGQAKRRFSKLLDTLCSKETIIHVHTWTKGVSSAIFPVAKKKGFRVAITVHDYFLVCPNGGLFDYPKREICQLKPMSFACVACHCDARSYAQKLFRVLRQRKQNKNVRKSKNISYIFISEFSKREFLKRYDKIPKDKQYFLTNPIAFEENRSRVACEDNDVYLFIGGLTEVKGIRLFCEAVTRAGVKAVVIGQGVLREELEEKYKNVAFVGWKSKEEMLPYLQQARCLIFPSVWYEASPLTPLEVLAYGVPVVCSDVNAASDYVIDGENGLVYNGKSVDALLQSIEKLQEDKTVQALSKKAFETFEQEKYTPNTYVTNLVTILQEIGRK